MRTRRFALVFVAASHLVVAPAGAEPPPLRVEPSTLPKGMPDADEERLEASLRAGLERVAIPTTEDEGAPKLFMRVEADEADYLVTLEVLDAQGESMAKAEVECELCGAAELNETIAAAASRLRQRLDLNAEAVSLTVRTRPAAADVYVDDEPAGKTPIQTTVPAGPHALRIERKGYRPIDTTFEATGGSDSTFDYSMRHRAYQVALPWTLVGVGAVLVGGGAALVAIDGDPIRSECNADVLGNCEFIRNTQAGGIAMISVGAAAVISGAVMAILWRNGRRDRSQAGLRLRRWSL